MKKRMLSFLLVLTLMLSMLPAMAPAASAASNMVAKVEAVGTGYTYDSEKGAFAPTFSSMTAYDPGGNIIDIEGFVWSTPFYTTESFGSANRLFNEPEDGETYYFGIYVDQYVNEDVSYDYTDSKDLMEKSVVTLPGFDVECISFMEREMQSYLELTYAATKLDVSITIGDAKIYPGETFYGSRGGTLTYSADGTTVTMTAFDHFLSASADTINLDKAKEAVIVGVNTIAGENGSFNISLPDTVCGTMYDSLTVQGVLCDSYLTIDGGYYTFAEQSRRVPFIELTIKNGASVQIKAKKLEFNSQYDIQLNVNGSRFIFDEASYTNFYRPHSDVTFTNAEIEATHLVYTASVDDKYHLTPIVSGGAYKGPTTGAPDFFSRYSNTFDLKGNFTGWAKIKLSANVYVPFEKPASTALPYQYIDIVTTDHQAITCVNATASMPSAKPGTYVTITAGKAPAGKVFDHWLITRGIVREIADPYATTTTIKMGVMPVTVQPVYRDNTARPACTDHSWTNPVYTKEVTCGQMGQTIAHCIICGKTKTATVPIQEAHVYNPATCTEPETCIHCGTTRGNPLGHSFQTVWSFNETHHWLAATCEHTDEVKNKEQHIFGNDNICDVCQYEGAMVNPFTDVPVGSFCYEPVQWAVDNGITNGTSATTFDPLGTCLRAHVVTFLHRAAGTPEPTSARNPFTDVKPGDFFYKPVLWAVEKGITNGTSATTFGSGDVCNRAAVVTFLWRAKGSPEPQSTRNPFEDVKSTDFFYKAVLWAVENNITNGVDATHFGPGTNCNRAQVVTFLYRAYK